MTVYALHHPDGRWLFHLPKPDTLRSATDIQVLADGQPMEKLHGDWWATPTQAGVLSAIGQQRPKTVGYRLTDPDAVSVRYPATLSLEEWEERRQREGDTLWELYTHVDEDQPPIEHVYDGPVMVLQGREPPSPDEPQWIAQLPMVLGNRPEYLHLFPGRIPGLRKHLKQVIAGMPRVEHCFDKYDGYVGLHVVVKVPYDQPRTEFRRNISRSTGKTLKTGRTVPVTVERRLYLPVPADVSADSYTEGLAAWDQAVEYWTRTVQEASVAACSACDGKGHVPSGSVKYSR
ncbi:hypothetical protein AB0G67_40235 [Streptomyces sp. NPDC021056]|uniref:hypothetical protein n=1 Tax=Streptomyces sp. NPDC021056 TaxID=3155012 RepID=UPI0033D4336C